jgi:hypothetical protein
MAGLGGPFNRFLASTAISSLGDGLLITTLPLLATLATKNATLIAGVFAAGRFPWLFGLAFGSYADRRDARRVMIRSDLVRGGVLTVLVLWLILASRAIPIGGLYIAALSLSALHIVFWAASNRATPSVVTDDHLEAANGRFLIVNNIGGEFVGPALGPVVLFEKSGSALLRNGFLPIAGDALSFFASAALLKGLPPVPAKPVESSLREDVVTGWNWFMKYRPIRTLTFVIASVGTLTAMVLSTEVILIKKTLGLSNFGFGIFTAVMAAGAVVGGALGPRCIKIFGPGMSSLTTVLTGICYLGMVNSRSWPVVFTLMFVQQFGIVASLVQTVAIRQRVIPDHLRGRVMALSRSIVYAMQIFGALVGGWIITWTGGTDAMLLTSGSLILLISLLTARLFTRQIVAMNQQIANAAKAAVTG